MGGALSTCSRRYCQGNMKSIKKITESHVMFMFINEFLTVHIAQQSNTEVAMTTYTCNTHTHMHTNIYTQA